MAMRKCWNCGNVADHESDVAPGVCCRKCGSQDTRLIRRKDTLHHGRITVGDFLTPLSADLECDSIPEAMIEAQRRARECPGTAIAVWEEDEPVRVYLRGYELAPMY